MKYRDTNTVADLLEADRVEAEGGAVGTGWMECLVHAGLAELPNYDFNTDDEYFYSDLAANAECLTSIPTDLDDDGEEEVESFLNRPYVKEFLLGEINNAFRVEATKYLEANGWEVSRKVN